MAQVNTKVVTIPTLKGDSVYLEVYYDVSLVQVIPLRENGELCVPPIRIA